METEKPQLLEQPTASENSDKPIKIGIIADIPNAMIESAFESQLMRAIRIENPSPPIIINATPLLNRLHTQQGENELRGKLNGDYKAIVAMIGVPSASHYDQDIHQILSVWSSGKKPVLLIASNDVHATQKAVDSWQGWELLAKRLQQPVETCKKAVIVNDEYIIAQSGEKALAQIKNSITLAESLKSVLASPATTPSISVQKPRIEGMTTDLTLKA